jgi:predicted NUDIX family NTP pyrophosphohydrolase
VPSVLSSGLLLYRVGEAGHPADGPSGEETAARGTRLEVLLFPRAGTSGAAVAKHVVLRIPVWELEPPGEARPASRAGQSFSPRPRGEKPRLTAQRTMDRLLDRARVSFAAITGVEPPGPFLPLGGVKMRRHRIVYVWGCACRPDTAPAAARFLPLDEARAGIEPQQRRFLDQLAVLVGGAGTDGTAP